MNDPIDLCNKNFRAPQNDLQKYNSLGSLLESIIPLAYFCVYTPLFAVDALQAILQAWNQTPDMSTNLAGWSSSQPLPCFQPTANWKGVSCFRQQDRSDGNCTGHISGL
jgi:hypothetical protein